MHIIKEQFIWEKSRQCKSNVRLNARSNVVELDMANSSLLVHLFLDIYQFQYQEFVRNKSLFHVYEYGKMQGKYAC